MCDYIGGVVVALVYHLSIFVINFYREKIYFEGVNGAMW